MKEDKITEKTIQNLVDHFYEKVRNDEVLSPIFLRAIGPDAESWAPHMQTLYDFWSSVMLNTHRYRGNPLQKHRELPKFDLQLFDQWLALFQETAHEIHTAAIAQLYIEKSQRIAESLKLGLSL